MRWRRRRHRIRPTVSRSLIYLRLFGCAVDNCIYPRHAQGFCEVHYRQHRRGAVPCAVESRGPRPAFSAAPLLEHLSHLSPSQAAARLGITPRHLRRIRDAGRLTIIAAERYADALDVHPKALWASYPVPCVRDGGLMEVEA